MKKRIKIKNKILEVLIKEPLRRNTKNQKPKVIKTSTSETKNNNLT
jgi:hypothetical protein